EVGEQADFKKLLLTRAEGVLELLRSKSAVPFKKPQGIPYLAIGSVLAVLAFVGGILTNEFSVTDNRINLLSPPLLGVIAWNLIIYCWIATALVFNRGKSPVGYIRRTFASAVLKLQTRGSHGQEALVSFYGKWTEAELPLLRGRIAEILHFSAALFGLGLIASIGIHGWGTEYTVGWESTWLSDKPAAVLTFINLFYGMIPVNADLFNQLTPQVIESMKFGAGHGQNAAPWLAQLFYIIFLIVVVPRILLGLYAYAKARYIENHFPIDLDSVYYSNILRQWRGQTMLIQIIPFSYPLTDKVKDGIQKFASELHPENSRCIFSEAQHENTKLPEIPAGEQTEVIAVFAMTSTPETEVQGRFIAELKQKALDSKALLRVVIDTSGFLARFANTPQRIAERKKNWSNFLAPYGVSFAFVNLTDADTKDAAAQFEQVR
uniref:DUF2868 domain-containing protein n=1 Tax=uncultured Parasutterella sp. TaxID=1263098 RepID=UPI0025F25AE3